MDIVTITATIMAKRITVMTTRDRAPRRDRPAADAARRQLLLQSWFSPGFPIGGFAFSHGLEWAHECGAIGARAQLESWLSDLLRYGSGHTDAVLLCAAYHAFARDDARAMQEVIDLAAALQPSRERWQEATVQGQAFLGLIRAAYPHDALTRLDVCELAHVTLAVAVGFVGAAHGVARDDLCVAYLGGFIANLSSAAVRLGIVGQTDGQRVVAASHDAIVRTAAEAAIASLDDLGSAALVSDLFSLQHETQYSRLFRS